MKRYIYNIFGTDLEVWVAATWTKVYVKGTLADFSLDKENTVLMVSTSNSTRARIEVNMSYDSSRIESHVYALTASGDILVDPERVE